ncbi:MAG: hypothetical protein OH316_02095 [Candidatus Parvarchaeota archaeon]|nr:hypothetical protein [Candidatus Parvarchaeota archaeon]
MQNFVDRVAENGKEFIFKLRNGTKVGSARSVSEFISRIRSLPIESIEYHASNHHFEPWFRYLKLNDVADKLGRLNSKGERLRQDILNLFR